MATLPNYRQDILDNPVQRAERAHILRSGMSRFWRAVYAISIFTIIAPILWGFSVHFHKTLEISVALLFFINAVMIFVVEMRVMSHSAESIRREFQGKTWDLLILTGVDTWRLILGKWLGAIRGNRREILFLYALRVSTFMWAFVMFFLPRDGFYSGRYDEIPAQLWNSRIDVDALIIGAVIMAFFLTLEMMLISSLPMALSLFRKTRKSATWIALGLRIGIPIALGVSIGMFMSHFSPELGTVKVEYTYSDWVRYDYSPEVNVGIISLATALADNGFGMTGATSLLNTEEFYDSPPSTGNMLVVFYFTQFIGIGLYLTWIWVMLRLANYGASRYNVSAPGFVFKGKPKRQIKAVQSMTGESPAPTIPQPKPRSPRESNLLGIQNPALYRCEVSRYETSQLEIAVYRMTERSPEFIVRFIGVSFFTGAMTWANAKFEQLGDKHLRQYASNQKLDADNLPVGSNLYVVKSQGNRTRIIATNVQVEMLTPELV
jgi:hypothetical protein